MTTYKTDLNKAIEYFDNKSKGKFRYWKPVKEISRIRILPSWDGGLFFREIAFHFQVGFDKRTVLCPRRTPGILAPCPICEYLDKYRGQNTEEVKELFSTAGAKTQYLYNIIDLENPDNGVQVFCSGKKVWTQLMSYMKDVSNWGDFTDDEQGFNITITKEGKEKYSSYDVKLDRLASPVKNKEWLSDLKDLNKEVMAQQISYADIKKLLVGAPVDEGPKQEHFGLREPEGSKKIEEDILRTMDDDVLNDETLPLTDKMREEIRSKLS